MTTPTETIIPLTLDKPIHPKLCPSHIVLSIESTLYEDTIQDLAYLNSMLKEVGVELELKNIKRDNYEHNIMSIRFNSDTYISKTTRHAGRPVDANKHGNYRECSVMELQEMLKTMKHDEIIKELRCPRATFYRILRTLRELDDWEGNTSSIWYYTS